MAAGGGRPPGPDSSLEPYVQTRIFKIIVIGDSNVGKTCLTFRFCGGTFPDKTEATIGVDFREKTVEIEGERIKVGRGGPGGRIASHRGPEAVGPGPAPPAGCPHAGCLPEAVRIPARGRGSGEGFSLRRHLPAVSPLLSDVGLSLRGV